MRTYSVVVGAALLVLAGCKESKPPAVPAPAPKPAQAVQPAKPPSRPVPSEPPVAAKRDPAAERTLLRAIEKLDGYNLRFDDHTMFWAQFRSPGPKDADLQTLAAAIRASGIPVGLNLNSCDHVTDAGLIHLKNVPNLVGLYLGYRKMTEKGLEHLAGMTNLEELSISSDAVTDAGLKPLAKLTKMRKLSLYSKNVTEAGYVHFAGMTQMEKLDGSIYRIGDTALGHMKGMTKLQELDAGSMDVEKLSDAGMAHIQNFTELRKLEIRGQKVTATGLAALARLKKLEKLEIVKCPGINGPGMAALKDLTNLQELQFVYCGALKPEATAHLSGLTKLKKIRFEAIQDEALKGIGNLKQLEELQLFYTWIGDAGLAHLAGLKGLRELDLMNTQVTDAGLEHLKALTNLEKLNLLNNGRITGSGLKDLGGLANLKTLYLSDCKINDAGLKHLAGLTSLKDLGLGGNPITDAGAARLKALKNLRDLKLTGTKVTEEGAEALKKALPQARILDASGAEVSLTQETRPRSKVEDLSKVAPASKLTAKEFSQQYKKDKVAAGEKYKNKVVELTGVVESFGRDISGGTQLRLTADKDLEDVVCMMVDEEPWARALPGQKVTVKGKWPEFNFSPALIYCVFVETGAYKPTVLTAEQLAKEYAANPEATNKKYNDKHLVLTGEIISKDYNSAGAASIGLKNSTKVKVSCSFTAFEKDIVRPLKVGKKVKVIGKYTLNLGKDEVSLYFCLPFKKP